MGHFCEAGTGVVVFTLTQGKAPFTVNYTKNGTNQSITSLSDSTIFTLVESLTDTAVYQLVSISDANGCFTDTLSNSVEIQVHELPTIEISAVSELCESDNASIRVQLAGNGKFNFRIQNDNTGVIEDYEVTGNDTTVVLATNQTAGTNIYSVVSLTDGNGCSPLQLDTATITINPLPTVSVSLVDNVCEPEVLRFAIDATNGTGGYGYTYTINGTTISDTILVSDNTISNLDTITVSGLAAGTYTLAITRFVDEKACVPAMLPTPIQGTVNPKPTADFTFTSGDLCDGSTIDFTATQNGIITQYLWDFDNDLAYGESTPDELSNPNKQFTFTGNGTFRVGLQVITAFGCIDTLSKEVVINPLPTGTVGNDTTICYLDNNSDGVNDGVADLVFSFTEGVAPFTVVYQDDLGNSAVTLTGLSDGDKVSVNPAIPTFMGTPQVITYTLQSIVDSKGCIFDISKGLSSSMTITVKPAPTAEIAVNDNFICLDEPVELTISNFMGDANFTYQLDTLGDGSFIEIASTGIDSVFTFYPKKSTIYNLIRISDSGAESCENILNDTVGVKVRDLPTAIISGATEFCLGGSGTLEFTVTEGTATGLESSISNYTIRYAEIVNGVSTEQTPIVVDASLTNSIVVTPTDTTTYKLISIVDGSGEMCESLLSDSVIINVNPLPEGKLTSDDIVCSGTDVRLTFVDSIGVAPYTIVYGDLDGNVVTVNNVNDGDLVGAPITVNSDTTIYLISITERGGLKCSSTLNRPVTIRAVEFPQLPADTTVCEGTELILDAESFIAGDVSRYENITYNWTPTGSTSSVITIADDVSQTYTVTGDVTLDGNTCPYDVSIDVVFENAPEVLVQDLQKVCYDVESASFSDTLRANGDAVYEYRWILGVGDTLFGQTTQLIESDFESFNGSANNKDETTIPIVITDANTKLKCFATANVPVLLSCPPVVGTPNAFTPNDDGTNDVFKLALANVDNIDFRVFNRWGELIYLETDKDEDEFIGWNGKYRSEGALMPSGVYPWKIIYYNEDTEQMEERSGSLLLIR